jgi:hypothetical protein
MTLLVRIALVGLLVALPANLYSQTVEATRPLLTPDRTHWYMVLTQEARLLEEPQAIAAFLDAVDGEPPDWAAVYGHGHHDPGHDERLFHLNRERDAKREGKQALQWRVTFLWSGELSGYDPKTGGFSVAVGPKFNPTSWGIVRFKPEDVPPNLVAIPNPSLRESLRRKFETGQRIEITVAMTGRLVSEESVIYDFAHDEPGKGMVMPVVRVERLDYLLVR